MALDRPKSLHTEYQEGSLEDRNGARESEIYTLY